MQVFLWCSCDSRSNGAVNHVSEIEKLAKDIGYPVVIKAASGGGGKVYVL